jgi:transposase
VLAHRPLPDNLPVERIVEPTPCACGKCGSERLHKLGAVVSKTLECEPRRWKIIEHVREKFSCRDCEAITEAPAPSDVPTRPKPRPASPDDLKARLKVTRFAKYHASHKTALVGCVRPIQMPSDDR